MAKNVFDVAKYVLERSGRLSTWKLQKLVYYSQAWHLVWQEESLFPEEIQAWANGPVTPELYAAHKGLFSIDADQLVCGDSASLLDTEKQTIDKVVDFYGQYNGQQLSDITHSEMPWIKARGYLGVNQRGQKTISLESMAEFYTSLPAQLSNVEEKE